MKKGFDGFPGEVLAGEADILTYSYDSSLTRALPDAVAFPGSAEEVRAMVAWCAENRVPFLARGAGTNLSGGCVPLKGGLVISLMRMNRILAIDTKEEFALVEPGVVNLHLQQALACVGRFYAPDPASHKVCTLGGNVAENAGGPRCLKYGVTTNHVRALEAVMPDGALERFSREDRGPEIMSLLIGSEGTMGVVTKIWCGILPKPEAEATALAAFPTLDAAMSTVSAVIAAGIVPRDMEAMDRLTLETIEAYAHSGYPMTEAVLLFEVEGDKARCRADLSKIREIAGKHGCEEFRLSGGAEESARLWEGRRSAYAALARKAPSILVEDGVVPRDKLPEAARRVREIAAEHGIQPALLFHAGDGNLHPNIVFDERDPELTAKVKEGGHRMLKACVELGGSISGEHGIGIDKRPAMPWLFSKGTLELFGRIKRVLDPDGLANPDKVLPLPDEMPEGDGDAPDPEKGLTGACRSLVDRLREKTVQGDELTVLGSGTKAPGELRSIGEVLTTRSLASVIELDKANYTLRVETGVSPAELKKDCESPGIYIPVPLVPGTLGGLLACRSWPRMRDHVLGMRVLLADGTVCELGGKTVKNVAGYDVSRLLLGSWGTLAVILDVTLRVYPTRFDVPGELPAPERPEPGRWHRKLKEAFDPEGRLNRWAA